MDTKEEYTGNPIWHDSDIEAPQPKRAKYEEVGLSTYTPLDFRALQRAVPIVREYRKDFTAQMRERGEIMVRKVIENQRDVQAIIAEAREKAEMDAERARIEAQKRKEKEEKEKRRQERRAQRAADAAAAKTNGTTNGGVDANGAAVASGSGSGSRKRTRPHKGAETEEDKARNKEKRLLKLVGAVVVKCMSSEKKLKVMDTDQFKNCAKEVSFSSHCVCHYLC